MSTYNEVTPSVLGKARVRKPVRKAGGGSGRKPGTTVVRNRGNNTNASNGHANNINASNGNANNINASNGNANNTNTNNTGEWPIDLQNFIHRSMSRGENLNVLQKTELQTQLVAIVEKASSTGMIFGNNWDDQKVPILDGSVELNRKVEKSARQPPNLPPKPKVLPADNILQQRLLRFENTAPTYSVPISNNGTFVGYSQDLEKNYLRLTSEPLPHNVRPQSTLEKSLQFIMSKYTENGSYSYVINQFKSMRQDLTVQHIKNEFTILVYETNGRVSLEQSDLGEFNQCQGQLKYLYKLRRKDQRFVASELSFLVYRIVYMIITNNTSEIYKLKMSVLKEYSLFERLQEEDVLYSSIAELFDLHLAVLSGDYHGFGIIYKKLERFELLSQLIERFICGKFQLRCLGVISKSYRKVGIDFLQDSLGVNVVGFLEKHKLGGLVTNKEFDCVTARGVLGGLIGSVGFNKVDIKGQI